MNLATNDPADARAHLEDRIRELTRVLEGANAERQLAMYRAHREGVPVADLARMAYFPDEAPVREILAVYSRDEDADDYPEGPRWVELWPAHGWGSSH